MQRARARIHATSCALSSAERAHHFVHCATAQRYVRYFFDRSKMSIIQGFSWCGDFRAIASNAASTEHACAHKRPRNPALIIPNNLCKKSSVERSTKVLRTARSGTNRANRVGKVIRQERGRARTDKRQNCLVVRLAWACAVLDVALQSPSFVMSSSFTTFGLALPPDAFIT
jgi:hypothetical protein